VSQELSLATWQKVVRNSAKLGFNELILSGGEPLLYFDFSEILLIAKMSGMVTCLFTNGVLIDRYLPQLISSRVDKICVSIYGACGRIHDKISQKIGSFDSLMNGIDVVKQTGIKIKLRMIVMNENKEEVEAVIQLANSLEIPLLLDFQISQKLFSKSNVENLKVSQREYGMIKATNPNILSVLPGDYCCSGGCRALEDLIVIDPAGQIFPCTKTREMIGDAKNGMIVIDDEWKKRIKNFHEENRNKCLSCTLNDRHKATFAF
jgi:MoaA/NifB/PqqE/SkfB family radical SAM enzyme